MSINERVRLIRQTEGCTMRQFAARLGISSSAISQIETGRTGISDQTVVSICREFGIREEWLRNGVDPMKVESAAASEMSALVEQLFRDRPETFKARLISILLRYDPDGPQWQLLEDIYDSVASGAVSSSGAQPDDTEALHAELDRQIELEKGEKSSA